MVAAVGGSAAADPNGGAEIVRGAAAAWWRHDGGHGTFYFIDVYDWTGTYTNRPTTLRGYFGAMPCDVGRHGRPVDCRWRQTEYHRVKVDSFEIDPLMSSAHALVHYGDKRGEVSWTGRGDYHQPFIWQSLGQLFVPPYWAHAYANATVFMGRGARATGDLFGLRLKRSEFRGASMIDLVFAGAGACLTGPWC
jgi:hypothetical protein